MSFVPKTVPLGSNTDIDVEPIDLLALPALDDLTGIVPVYAPPRRGKTTIASILVLDALKRRKWVMVYIFCPEPRPEWELVRAACEARSIQFVYVKDNEDISLEVLMELQHEAYTKKQKNDCLLVWDDQMGTVNMNAPPFNTICTKLAARARQPEMNIVWFILAQYPIALSPSVRCTSRLVFFAGTSAQSAALIFDSLAQQIDLEKVLQYDTDHQFICFDTIDRRLFVTKAQIK